MCVGDMELSVGIATLNLLKMMCNFGSFVTNTSFLVKYK